MSKTYSKKRNYFTTQSKRFKVSKNKINNHQQCYSSRFVCSFNPDAYKSWKTENQEPVDNEEKLTENGNTLFFCVYSL